MEQSLRISKVNKWSLSDCLKIMSLNYRTGEACLGSFPESHILFVIWFTWCLSSAGHLKASVLPNVERATPAAQAGPPLKASCSVMSLLAQFQTIHQPCSLVSKCCHAMSWSFSHPTLDHSHFSQQIIDHPGISVFLINILPDSCIWGARHPQAFTVSSLSCTCFNLFYSWIQRLLSIL